MSHAPARTISPGQAYALEHQVGHLLRRAHQRHASIFLAGFAASGLTPMQWAALARLVQAGSLTQNLLGRMTATDPATVQGVVRRLLARGLVRRERDPADRRTLLLSVTEAGRALYQAHVGDAFAVSAETLEPLTEAERTNFLDLLRRLT